MSEPATDAAGTASRRRAQHRDRWSSYGGHTGIAAISDVLSAEGLRQIEIFAGLDDAFLERISPDVSIVDWRAGSVLFEQGSYLDLAFFVLAGEVELGLETPASRQLTSHSQSMPIFDSGRVSHPEVAPAKAPAVEAPATTTPDGTMVLSAADRHQIAFLSSLDFDLAPGGSRRLGPGELFGEIGAMSGWPQSGTARAATDCQLAQIRVPALRLMKRRSSELRQRVDRLYRERALRQQLKSTPLFAGLSDLELEALAEAVELVSLEPGEVLAREGDPAQALYLVRSGFLRLSQRWGEGEIVATYLSKGMTFGEVELLVGQMPGLDMTATSVEYAELVRIPADVLLHTLEMTPQIRERLWHAGLARLKESGASRTDPGRSAFVKRALDSGLVQGSSILLIDLESCTRCDDCVRACAGTHGGRPRFVREGERIDRFLVPRSCYHCRDPVCLVGCPTGAIHRAGIGDVVAVSDEICIGCGTCASNCPYDAIVMHDMGETWPGDMVPASLAGEPRQVASKCDLCAPLGHDPACVESCPQGCAFRVGSLDEIRDLFKESG